MKVLVTGAKGMLGSDLVRVMRAREGYRVIATDIEELSVTDEDAVRGFLGENKSDAVVNCAALTDVDACETEKELAFAVNARAPAMLARAARDFGCRLVHISTDYVFDGRKGSPYTEEDEPKPINVYGQSKLEGERAVMESGCNFVIVRTAWLYGRNGRNFVDTMIGLARERSELRVVTDQIGCPTWTVDLAEALIVLLESGCEGLFHVVNSGHCLRFELARAAMEIIGRDIPIYPITSAEYKRAAEIPPRVVLDCGKFQRETGREMRSWRDALAAYLAGRRETR